MPEEKLKILVAEDNEVDTKLFKALFEKLDYEVDYVSNGQEAVEKLRMSNYNLCLMDIKMPVMDGLEATRIIRQELKKTLPIIAVTASVTPDNEKQCLDAGMNDFITKPFTPEELATTINRWLWQSDSRVDVESE